jgi:hypothetical protein
MASRLRFDHVVVAVKDLRQATMSYAALGFTVLPGGKHSHAPTQNALIFFADGTYIELLEWTDECPGDRWYRTFRVQGEGLVDFALVPKALSRTLEAADAMGIAFSGPLHGSRMTDLGEKVEWRLGRSSRADLPFFCEDLTPRALRAGGEAGRIHANGATGIGSVTVLTEDAATTPQTYRLLLGNDAHVTPAAESSVLGRNIARVSVGATDIVLVSSFGGRHAPAVRQPGSITGRNHAGPFALAVRTSATHAPSHGPDSTHGVLLDFVPLA